MAATDIRREVGDVSHTNFINPGVVDNSASTILGGLAEAGIKIDTGLAKQRFYDEMENLRVEREVGAPSVIAKQEEAQQQGLSPMDGEATSGLQQSIARDQAAYKQGRLTHDQMMLRAERSLRKAIATRPGLAQEFRGIAQQVLGRDVVGAGIDQLAADDADLMTAATQAAKDKKEAQDAVLKRKLEDLATIMPTGQLETPEQIEAAYQQMLPELTQVKRLKVTADMAGQQKSTMEAGQALRGPQATTEFVGWSAQSRLTMLDTVNQVQVVFDDPNTTEETKAQLVSDMQRGLATYISNANARAASGDIDPTVVQREIGLFEKMQTDMQALLTGGLATEIRDQQMKNMLSLAKQGIMTSSSEMPAYQAAVDMFGSPMIAQAMNQPGMQFNKALPISIGQVALGTDAARTTTRVAGDFVSSTAFIFGEKSGANEDTKSQAVEFYGDVAERFITVEDKDFNIRDFVGTQGFVHKLHLHRNSIVKAVSPSEAGTLGGTLAAAAYNAQRVLTKGLIQKVPTLRTKLDVKITPDGQLFHVKPGVTLTGPEQAAVLEYNQEWGGRQILQTIGTLMGAGDGAEGRLKAAQLVYKGAEGATKRRSARPASKSGGGSASKAPATGGVRGPSSRWWE